MTDQVITHKGKQRLIILCAALPEVMLGLDGSIVNLSLPSMAHYFHLSLP